MGSAARFTCFFLRSSAQLLLQLHLLHRAYWGNGSGLALSPLPRRSPLLHVTRRALPLELLLLRRGRLGLFAGLVAAGA